MGSKSSLAPTERGVVAWDTEIPPVIACAHCGRSTCDGCAPQTSEHTSDSLLDRQVPWEGTGSSWSRLLETTRLASTEPDRFFSQPKDGSVRAAVAFALFCESLAITSFCAIWVVLLFAFLPRLTLHALSSGSFLALGAGIFFTLLTLVVLVHVLWGLALEWGISRTGHTPNYRAGARFGLYACGWDLVTSPFGLVWSSTSSAGRGWFSLVFAGARAPRRALRAYLEEGRGLDEGERKRASWTAVWSTSSVMMLVFLSMFSSIVLFLLGF